MLSVTLAFHMKGNEKKPHPVFKGDFWQGITFPAAF